MILDEFTMMFRFKTNMVAANCIIRILYKERIFTTEFENKLQKKQLEQNILLRTGETGNDYICFFCKNISEINTSLKLRMRD